MQRPTNELSSSFLFSRKFLSYVEYIYIQKAVVGKKSATTTDAKSYEKKVRN
jgi:hypothetical protein